MADSMHSWLAVVESTRCTSSGAAGEEVFQFLELQCIVGAAAGGVDQHEFAIAHRVDGFAKLLGDVTTRSGEPMMSAYLLELIDGGDPIGVEGDQPDAVFLAEL